jgi:hypothetical protein
MNTPVWFVILTQADTPSSPSLFLSTTSSRRRTGKHTHTHTHTLANQPTKHANEKNTHLVRWRHAAAATLAVVDIIATTAVAVRVGVVVAPEWIASTAAQCLRRIERKHHKRTELDGMKCPTATREAKTKKTKKKRKEPLCHCLSANDPIQSSPSF